MSVLKFFLFWIIEKVLKVYLCMQIYLYIHINIILECLTVQKTFWDGKTLVEVAAFQIRMMWSGTKVREF